MAEGDRRRVSVMEDAFLASLDKKLRPLFDKLDQALAAVKTAKNWAYVATVGAALNLLLLGSVVFVIHNQNADRRAGRANLCRTLNDNIERARLQTEAILASSSTSRTTLPPDAQAQRDEQVRIYVERQGFRLVDGRVVAATFDCDEYVRDPAAARPHFRGG